MKIKIIWPVFVIFIVNQEAGNSPSIDFFSEPHSWFLRPWGCTWVQVCQDQFSAESSLSEEVCSFLKPSHRWTALIFMVFASCWDSRMAEGAEEQPCLKSDGWVSVTQRSQNVGFCMFWCSSVRCSYIGSLSFCAGCSWSRFSLLVMFHQHTDDKPGHTPGENTVLSSLRFIVAL